MTREEKFNETIKHFTKEDQDIIKKDSAVGLSFLILQDSYEAQLKAKDEEIERHFGLIKSLWKIIDDIDTYGDMAKSDDVLFRSLVEKKQKERWKLPISTDGYSIYLKDNK